MITSGSERHTFQLEALESRTLLAGDAAALNSDTDFYTNLKEDFAGSSLAIVSEKGGDLTILSDLLPDSVDVLEISGFAKVTVKGARSVEELHLWNIGSVVASELNVTGELEATGVRSLQLHSLTGLAWLYGKEMKLEVVDAQSVTILSAVDKLTLVTQKQINLYGRPELGSQEVQLQFGIENPDIHLAKWSVLPEVKPDPGSQPGTGGGTTPDPVFVIIIVSRSSPADTNASLQRLQDALQTGDVASIKLAFADYLKSVQQSASQGAESEIMLSGDQRPDQTLEPLRADQLVPSAELDSSRSIYSGTIEVRAIRGTEAVSAMVHSDELAVSVADQMRSEVLVRDSLTVDASGAQTTMSQPHRHGYESTDSSRAATQRVIDGVRSALAGLASDLNSNIQSVSAYIVERVENDLEPGELPGLLVEPRSSRARRGAGDWVEI